MKKSTKKNSKPAKKTVKTIRRKKKKSLIVKINQSDDIYKIINKLQMTSAIQFTVQLVGQAQKDSPSILNIIKDSNIKVQKIEKGKKVLYKLISLTKYQQMPDLQELQNQMNDRIKNTLGIMKIRPDSQ